MRKKIFVIANRDLCAEAILIFQPIDCFVAQYGPRNDNQVGKIRPG